MSTVKRILVVEDSLNDVELMRMALRDINLLNHIDVTRDGAEALDYLKCIGDYTSRDSENPIVIFLDLSLPKISGLELLKIIKSDPLLKLIPIVIFSSSKEESDVIKGYSLGVNSYVVKPVNLNDFISAIKELGLFWVLLNTPPQ